MKILGLVLCLVFFTPSGAVDVREIGWEDLIPTRNMDDPIEALTEDQLIKLGALARVRGFFKSYPTEVTEDMLERASQMLLERRLVGPGEEVVFVAGVPPGVARSTNVLKLHRIGDSIKLA